MKDYFSNLPQRYNSFSNAGDNKPAPASQLPQPSAPPMTVPASPEVAVVMGVVDITKESIRCFTDYAKCKEHEKTERKRIAATLRAIQYQIDAQKEVYLKELDKQYEERNRLYDMAEKAQEKALSIGDKEMLQLCYNLILNVYNKPVGSNGTMPSLLSGGWNPSSSF